MSLANCIIKNNANRRGKTLWTKAGDGAKPEYYQAEEESGEALFTARKIADGVAKGARYSDYAVLMRINALTRSYEQEFLKYNIPYKVFGGFRFFERKEIKDILAYLRLISNPFDSEAAERIINVPKRGIGGKTLEVMNAYARQTGMSLYDACLDCDELGVSSGTKSKLKDFSALIKDFIILSHSVPVAQLVRDVISLSEIRSAYDDGTDEGDGKLANIDEFIASVDDFSRLNPDASLDEYLSQVTLYSDTDEMDESDYVTIATIHAVKGLEFPCVFICGLEDGIMPSSRAEGDGRDTEEERRLMYVAITRAKEMLYLTRSKSRFLYGHRQISMPSKFISELSSVLGIKPQPRPVINNYRSNFYDDDSGYQSDIAPSTANFKPSFGAPFKKPASEQKSYSVGMKVMHKKFGLGMIIAVKNGGTTLNVAFDGQGIKELSASLAPLEIL